VGCSICVGASGPDNISSVNILVSTNLIVFGDSL